MSAFEENQQETPATGNPEASAFNDHLKDIKNESGEQKYDSVEKALDALKHSQSYIPELKSQLSEKDQKIKELEEKLSKASALDEVVAKLTADQGQQETTPQASGLDEQAVLNLVQSYTQEQQTAQQLAANEKSVSDKLFAKFGEKTKEVVSNKASELGMSVQDLQALSQKSPAAALSLFGASQDTVPTPTTGSYQIGGKPQNEELAPPEKSLLQGASMKEQAEYLRKVKAQVYQKYDIQV